MPQIFKSGKIKKIIMLTKKIHKNFVYDRRMNLLSDCFAANLETGDRVLDIGCGDGKIDSLIMKKVDVTIEGLDVLVRNETYIPVKQFNGKEIPFEDNSFDTIIIIDVLHHTDDPKQLLREIKRVAKKNILIKDHLLNGFLAKGTLKLMDYVGNSHYGVRLPYNYLTKSEWTEIFRELDLTVLKWDSQLHLYPQPWTLIFDRNLHFIANLTV